MPDSVLDIRTRIAFDGFSLDVAQSIELSGCTAIFGPSGAGKSTLLRLIAGFAKPDRGAIRFQDTTWCDTEARIFVAPHERPIGMVFQDGRLFPHLTVEQNLLYAERRSSISENGYKRADIIDAFDLSPLLHQRPGKLSGGERQRVALARTLLTRPRLLLLDEPLSALDRDRKSEILPYLEDLPERFGAPVIYVSHNVEEIIRLADRTLIQKDGRIVAAGPTADILSGHATDPPFHTGSVLRGVVAAHDEKYLLTRVTIGDGVLSLAQNTRKKIGDAVNIHIDARNVAIATEAPTGLSIRNVLPATVREIGEASDSPFVDVIMDISGAVLKAHVTRAAVDDLSLAPGQSVFALIKSASFDS
ncbi:MAG: molybdenum ABC transporter ATP-binding protein [Pseudomonadota bacterium]